MVKKLFKPVTEVQVNNRLMLGGKTYVVGKVAVGKKRTTLHFSADPKFVTNAGTLSLDNYVEVYTLEKDAE